MRATTVSFLLALCSATAACGSNTASTLSFKPRSAVFIAGNRPGDDSTSEYAIPQSAIGYLILSSSDDVCGDQNSYSARPEEARLTFVLLATNSGDALPAPGVYSAEPSALASGLTNGFEGHPVEPGGHNLVTGGWQVMDSACYTAEARKLDGGSVTLATSTALSQTGHYAVSVNGYRVAGTYSAHPCEPDISQQDLGSPVLTYATGRFTGFFPCRP